VRTRAEGNERALIFGANDRVIELADQARAERIARGENAVPVRRRKDGKIVRITLSNVSDDSSLVVHRGNPRRYSHDHENEVNPPRVWAMRHISSQVRDIFRASVLDNFVDKSTAPPIDKPVTKRRPAVLILLPKVAIPMKKAA
jgi:hypothetical protein